MSRSLTQSRKDFLKYYSLLFPDLDLKSYLTRKNPPVLLVSPFHQKELKNMFAKNHLSWLPLEWFPHVIKRPPEVPISQSLPGFTEGWLYSLNSSSLKPVQALDPKPTDFILDASAAPGGKTLAILNLTYPKIPKLIANDVSNIRFKHLKNTLKQFGYPQIKVTCNAIEALTQTLTYKFDKILLDAPCSGEKHIFNSKRFLKIWSPHLTVKFAHTQKILVESLLRLLKPNGLLVYSTCALSPKEDEELIDSVLKDSQDISLEGCPIRYNDPNSDLDPMFVAKLRLKP